MVCGNCARLGKQVAGPIVRQARPNPMKSPFRPNPLARVPASSELDVDPDYNVKIRQAREKLGLSQEDLGRMLNEKLSVIRMVESKKLRPDPVLARKFMHHLKVNLMVPISELEGQSGV